MTAKKTTTKKAPTAAAKKKAAEAKAAADKAEAETAGVRNPLTILEQLQAALPGEKITEKADGTYRVDLPGSMLKRGPFYRQVKEALEEAQMPAICSTEFLLGRARIKIQLEQS